jgi:hypothetical protein
MSYWIAVFVVFTGAYHPGAPAPTVVPGSMRPVSPAQLYVDKKDCVRNLGRDIAASAFGKDEVLPAAGGFAYAEIRLLEPR